MGKKLADIEPAPEMLERARWIRQKNLKPINGQLRRMITLIR